MVPLWKTFRDTGDVTPDAILEYFGVRLPPVPVEDIIEEIGVKVYSVPNPGWSGAVDSNGSHAVIWVDVKDSPERRRFTMAHELGHLLLHPPGRAYRDSLFDGSPIELEANAFAADLLMPMWMLQLHFDRVIRGDAHVLAEVSERFNVSTAAMARRVREAIGLDVSTYPIF